MKKYFKLKYYRNYFRRVLQGRYKRSYAQQGEDLLIQLALKTLSISNSTYLDIGANDPIISNNTYLLYTEGSRGVCVEPDPYLFKVIKQKRKYDVCLNVGIGPVDNAGAQYYVMTAKQLSTFNKEEAEQYVANPAYGTQRIEQVLPIPLVSINTIMERYFAQGLNVLSIDTEGYDLAILEALDFTRYQPSVICVETLRYDAEGNLQKMAEISEYLSQKGYAIFADTQVNTLFIHAQPNAK